MSSNHKLTECTDKTCVQFIAILAGDELLFPHEWPAWQIDVNFSCRLRTTETDLTDKIHFLDSWLYVRLQCSVAATFNIDFT